VKLLLDENLSFRIVQLIFDLYPGSTSVEDFNLYAATDEEIWGFAARNDFVIVRKYSDFRQRSFARGAPPKVIWVVTGNCSTTTIRELAPE
jgi:predicted nuclease of predicted toxin-antitoxin system